MDLKGLEDLHRLKTEGVITEEEFDKAKQRMLFGGRAAAAGPSPITALASAMNQGTAVILPAENDVVGWATLPLKRYADFTGRSCRKEFWAFQLIYVAIAIVLVLALGTDFGSYGSGGLLTALTILSASIAVPGLTVPLIAVQVRRFHDQDKSGLLALINLVPYVGVVVVYVMMVIEGTKGDNQFGPDPLAG